MHLATKMIFLALYLQPLLLRHHSQQLLQLPLLLQLLMTKQQQRLPLILMKAKTMLLLQYQQKQSLLPRVQRSFLLLTTVDWLWVLQPSMRLACLYVKQLHELLQSVFATLMRKPLLCSYQRYENNCSNNNAFTNVVISCIQANLVLFNYPLFSLHTVYCFRHSTNCMLSHQRMLGTVIL